jgi:hypothetical protein
VTFVRPEELLWSGDKTRRKIKHFSYPCIDFVDTLTRIFEASIVKISLFRPNLVA